MFHENKPSRRTMHSTLELLRKYCMGDDPIYTQILNSDEHEVFSTSSVFSKANYQDPFHSIGLPVFSIHGNHDDPSREGGNGDSLSALGNTHYTHYTHYTYYTHYTHYRHYSHSLPNTHYTHYSHSLPYTHYTHYSHSLSYTHYMHYTKDVLSVANLVNYFGKYENIEDVEITPVLIRKGATSIALYGLGAMRDDRLNRMW